MIGVFSPVFPVFPCVSLPCSPTHTHRFPCVSSRCFSLSSLLFLCIQCLVISSFSDHCADFPRQCRCSSHWSLYLENVWAVSTAFYLFIKPLFVKKAYCYPPCRQNFFWTPPRFCEQRSFIAWVPLCQLFLPCLWGTCLCRHGRLRWHTRWSGELWRYCRCLPTSHPNGCFASRSGT